MVNSIQITANDFDMQGKRVLVTGATGGLGTAMVHAFSNHGGYLVLASRNRSVMAALAKEIGDAEWHEYDQADLSSVLSLAERVGEIDVFINNAGILAIKPLIETEPQVIEKIIQVNLIGHITLACQIARQMASRKRGVIINISSQMGFSGAEGRGVYGATKAAIAQFTRTAAVEWGRKGIHVVGLAPGRTVTPINKDFLGNPESPRYKEMLAPIPVARFGTAEEIAKLTVFLASNAADYIVGETVIADGGFILTGCDWVPGNE